MRKKSLAICALSMIMAFGAFFVGCGGNENNDGNTPDTGTGTTDTLPNDTPQYRKVKLLTDDNFKNGFNLRGLNSATDSGVCKVINYGGESKKPDWSLAQWWSDYNLKDGMETITEDTYSLIDRSKTVVVDRNNGAITLGVNGAEEFETYNPVPPSMWPHLLIEQSIVGEYWLKDADKVEATLDFTVNKSENLRGGTQGYHAQFAWFIYVVDKNPESDGFGNFLWFGLNIFNSTQLYTTGTAQQDTAGGLGNFIYSLGSADIYEGRVRVGERKSFTVDLGAHVKEALETAQSRGFMLGTTYEDCAITGMNIGWEVFDRFDVSITLHDMGINFMNLKS